MEKSKINLLTVVGNTDDLLSVSKNGEMKMTRLFCLLPENLEENCETLDLCITSTNHYKEFPIFDKMLGHKIKISVDIIE